MRLRIRVARPMARGRKRLSVGPSSACTAAMRRSSPTSSWLCSALATADSSSLLQSRRPRARREGEDRAGLVDGLAADVVADQARLAGRRADVLGLGADDTGSAPARAGARLARCAARRRGFSAVGLRRRRPSSAGGFSASALASSASAALGLRSPRLGLRRRRAPRVVLGLGLGLGGLRLGASARPSARALALARRLRLACLRRRLGASGVSSAPPSVLLGSSAHRTLPRAGVAAEQCAWARTRRACGRPSTRRRTRARACGRRGRRSCARPSPGRSSSRATRS